MRIIGAANEFWRVRLTRIDEAGEPDLEWRDDVLYRTPPTEQPDYEERFSVEAVLIEDYDTVVCIATFDDRDAAEAFKRRVEEDLAEMTKSQFEAVYLTPPDTCETDEDPSTGTL